ncbi:MAG: hypothetical protein ACOX85_05560 [Candidatus Pararuminococcus gallinarum]|jgi:hypothetical protein
MTIKTSSSHKRGWYLFFHQLKRMRGVCLVASMIYLAVFTVPFIIRTVEGQKILDSMPAAPIYDLSGAFLFVLPVAIPLFTGVMALQFIHHGDRADLYYSLPVKRHTLFLSHYLAGLVVTLLPLLAIYLPCALTGAISNSGNIQVLSLVIEFLTLCLTTTISYTLVCFVGVFTPTLLDHVLYTAGIGAAISLGFAYTLEALSRMLVGFPYTDLFLGDGGIGILWSNPFLLGFRIFVENDTYRWPVIIAYLVLAILCLILSIIGFRKRGCERAGRVGGRTLVKEISKYVGAYIGGLLLSLGFGGMASDSVAMMILGLILGSFIAHTVIEAIAMRSFRTFGKSMKGYAIFAGCFLALFAVVRFDLTGYQYRIPEVDQVDSVSISYYGVVEPYLYGSNRNGIVLRTPEGIEAVKNIHTRMTQRWVPLGNQNIEVDGEEMTWMPITITYRLKNGMTVQRKYDKVYYSDFPLFNDLGVIPEFRKQTDLSAMVEPNQFNSFRLYDALGRGGQVLPLSLEEQEELFAAIAADRREETVEEYARPDTPALGCLSITATPTALPEEARQRLQKSGLSTYDSVVVLGAHYQNTIEFLKEKGWDVTKQTESSKVKAAYVTYASHGALRGVYPLFLNEPDDFYRFSLSDLENEVWGTDISVKYDDAAQIAQLRQCAYQQYEMSTDGYVVAFHVEGSLQCQQFYIPYDKAPDFLKEDLKKVGESWDVHTSAYIDAGEMGVTITEETIID